jgi:nuclear cap-binding protein subunit 1
MKTPFVAGVLLVTNIEKPGAVTYIVETVAGEINAAARTGDWKRFKQLLRLFACLQGLFEGTGIFPLLDTLFDKAAELQTASSEDTLGLELVKIILLTIPYVQSSSASASDLGNFATELLGKTDIIVSTPHNLEILVEAYPFKGAPVEAASFLGLLQKQLQAESENEWQLKCLPRLWKAYLEAGDEDRLTSAQKHTFPVITLPQLITAGERPIFPELYVSVYSDAEVNSVPPTSNIASTVMRDALSDTISALEFNRHAAAKSLIDLDSYYALETFVKRATPFDKLRDQPEGKSTWKPEDVAIDAVFSQLMSLPVADHKTVYYHALLTELCKLAPAAIAPSLGRVIRFLYRYIDAADLELTYRFMDWFSHHLSNFGFTWKWSEWTEDVAKSELSPKKAFIIGALDKEIRLSFAQRIRGTLPPEYHDLISESKEKDIPDFKYEVNPGMLYLTSSVSLMTGLTCSP